MWLFHIRLPIYKCDKWPLLLRTRFTYGRKKSSVSFTYRTIDKFIVLSIFIQKNIFLWTHSHPNNLFSRSTDAIRVLFSLRVTPTMALILTWCDDGLPLYRPPSRRTLAGGHLVTWPRILEPLEPTHLPPELNWVILWKLRFRMPPDRSSCRILCAFANCKTG